MYNFEDILAKLNNGETADSIAQSFTDALNQAVARKNEEEKKTNKAEKMTVILNLIADYVKEFYPEAAKTFDGCFEFEADDIKEVIAEVDKTLNSLTDLLAWTPTKRSTSQVTRFKEIPFDTALKQFFAEHNIE